jgi:hypothetical protein
MAAAWTPKEWDRIERMARAERKRRPMLRWPLRPLPLRVHRAIADGAALELRQWAQVATGFAARVEEPLLARLLEDHES